jgi:predicted nucleotidyltransferase
MLDRKRDYSEEIVNLCRQHNVKYLGLHGSGPNQEDAGLEDPEVTFFVEFFPMEPKQYGMCYFGLEKELSNLFDRNVGILDIGNINLPELLQRLTKRKTDIYKAPEPPM